eukprot:scaffold248654_cov27-Tisochrysis_lutea.AAC.1
MRGFWGHHCHRILLTQSASSPFLSGTILPPKMQMSPPSFRLRLQLLGPLSPSWAKPAQFRPSAFRPSSQVEQTRCSLGQLIGLKALSWANWAPSLLAYNAISHC